MTAVDDATFAITDKSPVDPSAAVNTSVDEAPPKAKAQAKPKVRTAPLLARGYPHSFQGDLHV